MDKPKGKVALVTGANGQLGHEFRALADHCEGVGFLFSGRDSIDVTDEGQVMQVFEKFAPDYCINCAAYTAVDKAEEEEERAFLINKSAVGHLIKGCSLHQTKLIHFSTDYVYDSIVDRPIREDDSCTPLSVYGQSKRAGEELLEQSDVDWINIRVSWLYSTYAANFVKTMLRLGRDTDQLSIVADQIGSPTYARDLAHVVVEFISQDTEDTACFRQHYNYSNIGSTNWADFAREIFKIASIDCHVSDTTTAAYGAPAPRPLWSVMSKDKICKSIKGISIRTWQEALRACIAELV